MSPQVKTDACGPQGDWKASKRLATLPLTQHQLRVDTSGVQAMANHWRAAAGELTASATPAQLGLSCQASANAVNAATNDITAFTADLAIRVSHRADHMAEADTRYLTNEADSANRLAAVAPSVGV